MKKYIFLFILLLYLSCQDFGKLNFLADLSNDLEEVSGTEIITNSDLIWMLNDSGNKPILYGVSIDGEIRQDVIIEAKNHDWEDLTSDEKGNIYIGDFGNNANKRKNLVILKVAEKELKTSNASVEKIKFSYPNQQNFPPKKNAKYFDTEAFFYFKDSLYIFTKSRVKQNFGRTTLYKVPAKEGNYVAQIIGSYENCNDNDCWITSADISPDQSKIALLSQKNVLIFSNFNNDNFFSGNIQKIELKHRSQKEAITFKDNYTLLITDERFGSRGGNLYELKI